MRALKNAVRESAQGVTQFELTSDLLRNLYKFNLTPVTKLVLLELTTHLNESKNGSVVFPSIGYIAEVLGIGLTAAKKAINDLIKEGLIIKSKRDNVIGNRNKYLLTPKVQNMTSERSKNEFLKQSENELFYIRTNKQEQIKEQTGLNKPVKIYTNSNSGGNVYQGEDAILAEYAKKHNARNIDAYINTLKASKSAEKIIKEYNKKHLAFIRREQEYNSQQEQLKEWRDFSKQTTAKSCGYSFKQLKERGFIK